MSDHWREFREAHGLEMGQPVKSGGKTMDRKVYDQEKLDLNDPAKPAWAGTPGEITDALVTIGNAFGNFVETLNQGLPDGVCHEEWGYDELLVIEIADAVDRWHERIEKK